MSFSSRLNTSLYMGFVTLGLVASIIGPIVAAAKVEIAMDFTQTGLVISGQFIGALFSVLLGGHLADLYGKKKFLIVGSIILAVGLGGSVFSNSFVTLLIWTLTSGIGFGAYEVGINALCADYTNDNKGGALNFLHFFFGVGAIFGPILTTLCLSTLFSWRLVFLITSIFPIVVALLLSTLPIPHVKPDHEPSEHFPFKSPYLWISGMLAFFYVGLEVSTYGWLPLYWKEVVVGSFLPPTLIASAFWGALTIARLFTGNLADKLGLQSFLIGVSVITVLATAAWAILPPTTFLVVVVILLGLLYAGIFPTNMAAVISKYPSRSGSMSSFITVFASLGGSLIPSALGKSADLVGIRSIPFAIVLLAIGLLFFSFLAKKLSH